MSDLDSSIQILIPLREPTFYILLSLTYGEKHGYALLKTIEILSQGKLKMSTGTLYEALARLLEQGLIERVDATEPKADLPGEDEDHRSRTRKVYRLTKLGLQVLRAEMDRMQRLILNARLRLGEEQSE
jgi:DNA-binding PadR family transcriptional regulator